MTYQPIPERVEFIAKQVVDSAYAVHSALGPGLLERVYQACLAHELRRRGFDVQTEVLFPVAYGDIRIDAGIRLDFLVEDVVIIEIKSVEQVHPVHQAQVISYLKLTGRRLGFLINFNVPLIRDGIRRICV